MTPLVSVIIPSYNHGNYIAAAITSVMQQTWQNVEIVITDDGSTDHTVEEIRMFNDPRIRLTVFEENRGACAAANQCIRDARGEFIAMLSSDDVFMPEKLERQVDFLTKHPETGAVFAYPMLINEQGEPFTDQTHKDARAFFVENRTRYEWLRHLFYHGNCLCHPTALIRRASYEQVGLYDPRLAQLPDYDMWIRLCKQFEIHVLPEPLVQFRIRDNQANASAARPEVIIRDMWEHGEVLRHYMTLSPDEFQRIFGAVTSNVERDLGYLACHMDSPAYQRFGLQALHEQAAKDTSLVQDLLRLTGTLDIHHLIQDVEPFELKQACTRPSRLSVILHLYYPDLWAEFREALSRLPEGIMLTVTGPEASLHAVRTDILADFPAARIHPTPNRGRDVAPFIAVLPDVLAENPDLVLKLHSKKSTHLHDGNLWRQNLLSQLLPGNDTLSALIDCFAADSKLGILVPRGHLLHSEVYLEVHEDRVAGLAARMEMRLPSNGWFFAAGSMFWFRPEALEPLLKMGLQPDEFEDESGQIDGTLAHAMERVFSLSAMKAGMNVAEIPTAKDHLNKTYSFAERSTDLLKREIGRLEQQYKEIEQLALQRMEAQHSLEKLLSETQAGLEYAQRLAFEREKLLATPGVNVWIAIWRRLTSLGRQG